MSAPTQLPRCNGKVRYASKRDAATVRNRRLRGTRKVRGGRRNTQPEALREYHCPDCNGWHLTHQR